MASQEELTGTFRAVRWIAPTADYLIGLLDDGTCVKGPAEPGELTPGCPYRFFGRWQPANGKYGPSFAFAAFSADKPHTREAVVQYICRAVRDLKTGIGPAAANKLYDWYSSDAVRKLRTEPAECAKRLKIKVENAHAAAQILERDARMEDCKIELIGLLAGKGFPRTSIKEIVKRWGPKAPALIRRDAFLLLTSGIPGAGFARCDNLYLSLGGDPTRLKRQTLCAWHAISTDGAGHTWHPPATLVKAIREKISSADTDPLRAIRLGVRSGWLAERLDSPVGGGNAAASRTWLAEWEKSESERIIAEQVAKALLRPPTWPTPDCSLLSPHQREQLARAVLGRLCILAGTPGTGKTWTAAALIRSLVSRYGSDAVAVCAPTGKAAVRIAEQLRRNQLPLQSSTIHWLLRPTQAGHGTGKWGFEHCAGNPLDYDWVIVDEGSMVDCDLLASLLQACDWRRTHLLLIGDPYQLPPVGHGAPLRDLLAAGVPYGELLEIRRNAGLIVEACARIKAGAPFQATEQFDDSGANLRVIPLSSPAAVQAELRQLYAALAASGKYDLFDDIQVVVALNDKSELSRKPLNSFLQSLVNFVGSKAMPIVEGCRYWVGDKVICLTNGQYPERVGSNAGHYLCNGEQGRVVSVDKAAAYFEFPDIGEGPRRVAIRHHSDEAAAFDLAYAITCHKSQGSEWPIVVVVGDEAAGRVACREWWYTAISRASKRCLIYGRQQVIQRQCRRVTLRDRKTFLVERLAELNVKPSKPQPDAPAIPPAASLPTDQLQSHEAAQHDAVITDGTATPARPIPPDCTPESDGRSSMSVYNPGRQPGTGALAFSLADI